MLNIKKIISWILTSSENPQAVSLTVKGILLAGVPTLIWLSGFSFFQHLTPDIINLIINYTVLFVQDALYTISFAMASYGLVRKIINTWIIPDAPVQPTVTITLPTTATAGANSSAKIAG